MMAQVKIEARERTTMVDLLRWVYRTQMADRMSGGGMHGMEVAADGGCGGSFSGSGSNAATIEANGVMGSIIRSTAWQQRYALHSDAEVVHASVGRLAATDWAGAGLLRMYAGTNETPHWVDTVPMPEPVRRIDPRTQREVIVQDAVGSTYDELEPRWDTDGNPMLDALVQVQHLCCPIRYWPSFDFIEASREEYRVWYGAMVKLSGMLPELSRWSVVGVGAEEKPWEHFTR